MKNATVSENKYVHNGNKTGIYARNVNEIQCF